MPHPCERRTRRRLTCCAGRDQPGRTLGDARVAGYSCPMKILNPVMAGLTLLLATPAHAIVGGGVPSAEGIGRSVVAIVGSRGNFWTGAFIAPKLGVTAAHCG